MKTVKKGKEIRRVKDKAAVNMTTNEGWKYCPKSEHKFETRGYTEAAKDETKEKGK